ncbi:putative uncharacterized protein [Blautia hydrogenotrophica CAG:147]|uniref:hypothetical protein n=1 Tax=Blautia hydrogenotrophica TaxID=53443 RepID=UPI00033C9054|nr:hypothetical protein [Blautia hydrogenotrophica]MEE0462527.1 hypothetical protein [Blautia hydrogenotrophica]CCX59109.1 putative uncharacterized protein [Blautia hydrogenotrophica CAG:147]
MIRENFGIKTIYIMIPVGKKMLIDHVGHKTKSPGAAALGLFYVYLYLKSTEVYNPFYCMKSKIL